MVERATQVRGFDRRLLHDLFNASPIGIVVEDLEGQPLFVNPAFCAFLGFSEGELCNKHCVDFSPAEDAERDWALFQQLRAGSIDHYQLEKRYFRQDGTLVWGSLSISLLNVRPSPLILAMVEDITEKKTAEEARYRYAAIVESSDDAIASGTLDGTIVSWNRGAERIYGYTEAEAVGMPITLLVPPEMSDEEHKILETLRAGSRIEHFETVRVTKSGKRINISLSISPIKDSSGKTVGCCGIARDITERKRAEEALRESEERFRLAQQGARLGTFERDVRTGRITWSSGLDSLYGLPSGSLDGKTNAFFKDLIDPADFEQTVKLIENALKTGKPTEGEWRAIWPDGSVHWIASRWQVLMDASREPSRVVGVNMDITERKRSEEESRESEERFRLAAQAGRMYAYTWDVTTDVIVRSPNASGVLGATGETPLTRHQTRARVHPDDRAIFDASVSQHTVEHPDVQISYRMLRPDGSVVWVEKTAHAMFDKQGRMVRVVGMVADITERKLAEEALRESEQRLRLAAQVGRMYAYEWDVTTKLVVRSSDHVKILGLKEPLGLPQQHFVDKIHADDRPKFLAALASLTPENPATEVTYRAMASDGTLVWLKSNGHGFFDGEGKLLRVIGMVADVTDIKRSEEAVSGITRKLIEAQEQERARIARELHDDISQRLALVAVELEQLRDNPSKVHTRLEQLRKQTTELSAAVQILSHDLHSSQLEYMGVVAGIKSWCKEFGERQRMRIDYRHDVRNSVPAEIGLSLFRILQEALHNAAKHSGVKRIKVQLYEESGDIHLTLSDLGRGFDVEAVKKGKGLGLTSMRERVRLINGTIAIDSKPMRGTTIHVRVPVPSAQRSELAG
jgi:PAS domain S-box-containing protein